MPKPTFLRLSDAKRQKFIEAALKEFSDCPYEKASISRLVENLRIAKGSVYQYFENKKDVYLYLITYASKQKQAYIQERLASSPENFFDWFETIHKLGLQFEAVFPHISRFLYNAFQERHADDLGDLHLVVLKQSTDYFEKLIKAAQAKGNIKSDVQASLLAFLLSQWSYGVQDFSQISASDIQEKEQLTANLLRIIKYGVLQKEN